MDSAPPPEVPFWEDPRVDVIVDHWLEDNDWKGDPSWPTVAGKTIRALELAGYRIITAEDHEALLAAYVMQAIR